MPGSTLTRTDSFTHTGTHPTPPTYQMSTPQKRKSTTTLPPAPRKKAKASDSDLPEHARGWSDERKAEYRTAMEEARQRNARIAALNERLKASWEKCRRYWSDVYELVKILEEDKAPMERRCTWMKALLLTIKEGDDHINLFMDILSVISNENLNLPKTVKYLVKELYWEFKRRTSEHYFFDIEEFFDAYNIYNVLRNTSLEKICPNIRDLAEDIFLYEMDTHGDLEYCHGMDIEYINNY